MFSKKFDSNNLLTEVKVKHSSFGTDICWSLKIGSEFDPDELIILFRNKEIIPKENPCADDEDTVCS